MHKLLMLLMTVPMMAFGIIVAERSEGVGDVIWYYEATSGDDYGWIYAQIISGYVKYSGDLTIPSILGRWDPLSNGGWTVAAIGKSAFRECTGLTSVKMQYVDKIEENAFYGCTGLKTVQMGSLTSIGNSAFYGCNNLTNIMSWGAGGVCWENIGERAFGGCSELTSIPMLNGVTNIGAGVFAGCRGLKSLVVPKTVKSIGDSALRFRMRSRVLEVMRFMVVAG